MTLVETLNANLTLASVNLDDLKELCARLGYARAPVLLHGSVLSDRFDQDSDIDVFICAAGVSAMHVLTYIGQQRIDVAALGPERLLNTIDENSKNGHDDLARIVLEGYPIAGNWQAIRDFSECRTAILPSFNIIRSKNLIVGTLHELQAGRRGHLERIGQASRLVDIIATAILRSAGLWVTNGPVLLRRLEQHDPQAAVQLDEAFRAFLRSGTTEEFLAICRERIGVDELRHQPILVSL
jgi:hypothetical protein